MNHATHPMEREEVMAYLDGELDAGRAAAVEAHLNECAECRALADDLRALSQKMAAWQVEPAPARIQEAISSSAADIKPPRIELVEERHTWLLGWRWKLVGAFAVVVLIAAFYVADVLYMAPLRLETTPEQQSQPSAMIVSPAPSSATPYRTRSADRGGGGEVLGEEVHAPKVAGGPMIIRTAALTIVTKEFDNTRAAMEQAVRKHGGYIAQLSTAGKPGSAQSLNATVRIPADKLEAALAELKTLGRIEGETVSGEEVTQQYVDLVARLANARHTEQRLVQVLQQRTGKVSEVLEVEQEIARVREEIERMDAQRKNLEKQVQFATVSLRITEEYKAQVGVPQPSVGTQVWNAAVDGYRSLTETVLGLALFLLRQGPVLLFWLALLWWPARLVWRRVRAAA